MWLQRHWLSHSILDDKQVLDLLPNVALRCTQAYLCNFALAGRLHLFLGILSPTFVRFSPYHTSISRLIFVTLEISPGFAAAVCGKGSAPAGFLPRPWFARCRSVAGPFLIIELTARASAFPARSQPPCTKSSSARVMTPALSLHTANNFFMPSPTNFLATDTMTTRYLSRLASGCKPPVHQARCYDRRGRAARRGQSTAHARPIPYTRTPHVTSFPPAKTAQKWPRTGR